MLVSVYCEILLSSPGTGGTLYSLFYSRVPGPRSQVPSPKFQGLVNKGTLLSECSFIVKSYGVVVVAPGILLSALGLGVVSILDS